MGDRSIKWNQIWCTDIKLTFIIHYPSKKIYSPCVSWQVYSFHVICIAFTWKESALHSALVSLMLQNKLSCPHIVFKYNMFMYMDYLQDTPDIFLSILTSSSRISSVHNYEGMGEVCVCVCQYSYKCFLYAVIRNTSVCEWVNLK